MSPDPKKPSSDDPDLDEALRGTFPASDPVAPVSNVEDEMARRRAVLKKDAADKQQELERAEATHADDLLDEALDETFPASDPVAVHGAAREPERKVARKKTKRKAVKKKPAKSRSKTRPKKKSKKKKARKTRR